MAAELLPDKLWDLVQLSSLPPGDRGYDAEAIRQGLRERGIVPLLAMRNTEHGSGPGRWRWVVEQSFAWLNQFRRRASAARSEPISMRHS